MKIILYCCGFFLLNVIFSCNKENGKSNTHPKPLSRIAVASKGFETVDNIPIRLWGLNYSSSPDLIEEDWTNPIKWAVIEKNIKDIHGLGANLVRVAIQYNSMMTSSTEPNQANLQQLRKLVQLANDNGLYFMISGLGAFRKTDQPVWYDALDETSRWATQALYWQSIAGAIGDLPNVFSYELMNEPIVPSASTVNWLPGGGMGGYFFAQNITRTPDGRSLSQIMSSWINSLTTEIRKKDKATLITVGFLPFTVYGQFAQILDINNTHIYPKTGEEALSDSLISKFLSNKPLIVTETFTLQISPDDWEKWIKQNNKLVAGWVGMHPGKTLEELTPPQTIPEAIYKDFIERFKLMSPTQK